MPLIRRDPPKSPSTPLQADTLARQLIAGAPAERWSAARMLGRDRNAVPHLAQALTLEQAPEVREAIFTSLIMIGTMEAGTALASLIASDDPQLRTGALDALGAMATVTRALLPSLLSSSDADVRLLSCELVRFIDPDEGTQLLSALLENEEHANVCGAAVDVLSETGLSSAADVLQRCALRFGNDPYLSFAINDAITRLSTRNVRNE